MFKVGDEVEVTVPFHPLNGCFSRVRKLVPRAGGIILYELEGSKHWFHEGELGPADGIYDDPDIDCDLLFLARRGGQG